MSKRLVVVLVERVIQVRIRRHVMVDSDPATKVHTRVTGSVIDGRNVAEQEVGIRTLSNCSDAEESAPATPGVSQQQHASLLGTPQQRCSGAVDPRVATSLGIARRCLLNLG